jgi:hypothetical protein
MDIIQATLLILVNSMMRLGMPALVLSAFALLF